ncbi:MAG: tetratricopeptide repeat protein [Gammaproteobacteria bacterium]|nr:tetratricopeptide repeat protein [Gammaproteobacteria bacterium]MDH3553253.1 tetratricopeptide repeat protein [Gammaproteobacteria bacterium]
MVRDTRFWTLMAVFQVLFGLAVFAITRDYYMTDAPSVGAHAPTGIAPATAWPNVVTESNIARLSSSATGEAAVTDPIEMSRQADEFFANRQYEQAAALYERLLAFGPPNADVHNNLGLTLHYLGRSTEALDRLNDGVAVDPDNQRIWLTLGFVNSQLGNTEQARTALTAATKIGSDESIRQSAMTMLENLP